ncbi:receptor-like protein 33 [Hibiscus syriacus]|uniref:receptor-like protein 33 n=1 Tax=Hibiscus syriacus TaxID=106335 RepID=UPI001922A6AE|nr:receptor-like protein 33 [Hibiscus syriacus]
MSDVAATSFLKLTSSLKQLSLSVHLPKTNWSSALVSLYLPYCGGFKGSIPPSFGNLTQIVSVDLSGNRLRGWIPDVFGNLTRLTSLRISRCNLSGPLPLAMFNLPKITTLDLSHNHLEAPFPNHDSDWLFNLPSLLDLDLNHNKLAGPIDRIQMPSSLQRINLSSNDFHGPLPHSIFDLVNLSKLYLSSNNLSGVIESGMLSKLLSLEVLDLSNNSLLSLSTRGNDVNCSFPRLEIVSFSSCGLRQFPNFFRTSKLKSLDLSYNMISGGISKWEAQGWEELQVLNISHNSLTTLEQVPGKRLASLDLRSNLLEGPILSTWLDLQIPDPLWFRVLLISKNKLAGNIPSSICSWTSLFILDLSRNSLNGTIPECLGSFISIELMNLQMNNLSGKIPDSFVSTVLTYLLLNDNRLEGVVPPSLSNSTSLEILDLGNKKLTDTFPHWLASLPSLQILILRHNRFHGSLPHSAASTNFSALRMVDLSGNEFTGILPLKLFGNLRAMIDKPEHRLSNILYAGIEVYAVDIQDYHTSVKVTTKRR